MVSGDTPRPKLDLMAWHEHLARRPGFGTGYLAGGLSEAFGDGEQLASADRLVGLDLDLDPARLTPDERECAVARIVKQGGALASHPDERLPGHIDLLGRDPRGPVLVAGFGDHQRRMTIAWLGELLRVAAGQHRHGVTRGSSPREPDPAWWTRANGDGSLSSRGYHDPS